MVDGYNYQVGSAYPPPSAAYSAYSPFNRNAGQVSPAASYTQPNPYGNGDSFKPSSSSGAFDIDGLSQNISDNIKRLSGGFGISNPNPAPTTQSNPASNVPQAEIQWALQLEEKVQKQGYQPTQEEIAKYQSIADRLTGKQTQAAAPAPTTQSNPASNVPQAEIQWALQLEEKVQKQGYQPTQEEIAKYQSIADRLTGKPTQTTAPAPTTQSNPASNVPQAEIQWALQLEEKVQKQGYQPTQEELAKYQDIANKLTAGSNQSQQQPVKTNTNWVEWSKPLDLPTMPSMNANAVTNNGGRLVQIPNSLRPMNVTVQPTQRISIPAPVVTQPLTTAVPNANTSQLGLVTQADINWALALEDKVQKQGYNPTPQELNQYNDIANKIAVAQGIQPTQTPVTVPAPTANALRGPITVQQTLPQQNYPQQNYVNSNPLMMGQGQPQNQQQSPSFFQKLKNGASAFLNAMK